MVKAEGNYILLQLESTSYMLRESISKMAEKLAPYGFVRIHRSFLVNAAFVQEIRPWPTGEYVLMVQGGKEYTVSRTYRKNLQLLAEAWIGTEGFVYLWLQQHGIEMYPNGVWFFDLPGLTLIYLYFQIPLMVLVFIPALDGIRPQWREATESLGGNAWHYWRYVAGPLLFPSFLGCTLLLFANAFSAYATAAALLTQGGVIAPLQVQALLTSETGSSAPGLAKALALAMVAVVLVVMSLYALLQRRTSQWLR